MREKDNFLYKYRFRKFLQSLSHRIAAANSKLQPVHELAFHQVAILLDGSDVDEKNEIMALASSLERLGMRISFLAYIDHNGAPTGVAYRHFNYKEVSWYYIPKSAQVERFLEFEYDLLINADLRQTLALHYVSALCKSPLKVGPHSELDTYYHLILDTKDTFTTKQYVQELVKLLNQVCFHGKIRLH